MRGPPKYEFNEASYPEHLRHLLERYRPAKACENCGQEFGPRVRRRPPRGPGKKATTALESKTDYRGKHFCGISCTYEYRRKHKTQSATHKPTPKPTPANGRSSPTAHKRTYERWRPPARQSSDPPVAIEPRHINWAAEVTIPPSLHTQLLSATETHPELRDMLAALGINL